MAGNADCAEAGECTCNYHPLALIVAIILYSLPVDADESAAAEENVTEPRPQPDAAQATATPTRHSPTTRLFNTILAQQQQQQKQKSTRQQPNVTAP